MTLEELNSLIDVVAEMTDEEKAEVEAWEKMIHDPADVYPPGYMSRLWMDMPRLTLDELPPELLKCLQGLDNVDRWRIFLLEVFPVGVLDAELKDKAKFEAKIHKAMKLARYQVNRLTFYDKTTKENVQSFSLALRGDDLLLAWEAAGGVKPSPMDMAAAKRKSKLSSIASLNRITGTNTPTTHVIPISRIAKETAAILADPNDQMLDVSKGHKGKLFVRVLMTYEGGDIAINSRKPITAYDYSVNDTVASLWEYGNDNHIFTPAMLCRAMMGLTDTQDPSQNQINEAVESLERQAAVRVVVDCTDQLKAYGIDTINGHKIRSGKVRTNLLMLRGIEIETTGGIVSGYEILEPPIRYEYSKLIGQVQSVDLKYLDIKETCRDKNDRLCVMNTPVRNSRQRIAIKEYLLRRVCIMKGKTEQGNKIKMDTLLKEIGYTDDAPPTRRQIDAIKKYVTLVLDYWVASGYIKGHGTYKTGRTFAGYTIRY